MQSISKIIFCYALLCLSNFVELPFWAFSGDSLVVYDYRLLYITCFILSLAFKNNYAFIASCLYIISGLAGLPIFAFGGGIEYIFEPSFGYILGLLVISLLAFYSKIHIPEIGVRTFRDKSILPLMSIVFAHALGLIYLLGTQRLDLDHFASMTLYQIFYDLFIAHLVIIIL
ncbi:MAG: biotin transporter BioY [Cyanobacteria bacterium]|nr:biotin transporter BioY [Cyanobacteriota bacterium]MDA1020434.1 biotin transporter BioY [Cyanobacteriota bacterium]